MTVNFIVTPETTPEPAAAIDEELSHGRRCKVNKRLALRLVRTLSIPDPAPGVLNVIEN